MEQMKLSGGNLHLLPDAKFKTVLLRFALGIPLGAQAAATALIPFLLKRGTHNYKDITAISRFLESLYGASLGASIVKGGERQLVIFDLNIPADRFLPSGEKILEPALQFLTELVTQPNLENGSFRSDYFAQEQTNLCQYVIGILNDKKAFAFERCVQEMCKHEPYGIYEYGTPQDIQALQREGVWQQYQTLLHTATRDLFVVGPFDSDVIVEQYTKLLQTLGPQNMQPAAPTSSKNQNQGKRILESYPVEQGKLVMGYRAPIGISDAALDGMVLFSTLLGGGPSSRLFRKVREEKSLAYYVGTTLEKIKGLMFVQAGLNAANLEQALQSIEQEFQSLQKGEIQDQELQAAKRMLIDRIRAIPDSSSSLIEFGMQAELTGRRRSVEEVLKGITAVSIPQILEAASSVTLDTIYYLQPHNSPGQSNA